MRARQADRAMIRWKSPILVGREPGIESAGIPAETH
jgi:hypothetical protein